MTLALTMVATYFVGIFAALLGALHFTFPRRFGFAVVLGADGARPPEFRLGPYRQALARSDLLGIVYVMNHSASLAILSIGVFDLFAGRWWGTTAGRLVSAWAGSFWWLRAASQLYVGRRRGDLFVIAWFAALGIVQFLALLD